MLLTVILVPVVTLLIPRHLHYETVEAYYIPTSIPEITNKFAKQYGVNPEHLAKVMKCESNGKQTARGDGNHAIGVFQFHESTFNLFEKQMGEDLDINSYYDQIKLTSWAFAHGKQKHWTCAKIVGLL